MDVHRTTKVDVVVVVNEPAAEAIKFICGGAVVVAALIWDLVRKDKFKKIRSRGTVVEFQNEDDHDQKQPAA